MVSFALYPNLQSSEPLGLFRNLKKALWYNIPKNIRCQLSTKIGDIFFCTLCCPCHLLIGPILLGRILNTMCLDLVVAWRLDIICLFQSVARCRFASPTLSIQLSGSAVNDMTGYPSSKTREKNKKKKWKECGLSHTDIDIGGIVFMILLYTIPI